LKDQTRRRILDASLQAFSTYGYRRVDVGRIADLAGLSRQGLYKYFPTKEALFRAVVEDAHTATLESAAAAAAAAEPDGPVAILTALVWARFGWFLDRVYGTAHGDELIGESNRECLDLNLEASQRFAAMVVRAIEREAARGRLDLRPGNLDAPALADLVLRAAQGLKSPSPRALLPAEFRGRLRQMISLLCAGLEPRGRSRLAAPRSPSRNRSRSRSARGGSRS
jgi:AcrR family transcriptional regulator